VSHLILFGAPLPASSVSPIKLKVKDHQQVDGVDQNLLMSCLQGI
jgi:hypothetical protein